MNIQDIVSKTDHTLLKTDADWEQVKKLLDEAVRFGAASACIAPCFVGQAAEYVKGKLPICTVIGFPNGYSTARAKAFEADEAVRNGADEIDMVINVGDVKAGHYEKILQEINSVKTACNGKLLKVIVETCLLTEEEKEKICDTVDASDADYIKTSTGFSTAGALLEDIVLWKGRIKNGTKIKAAGGIRSLDSAAEFIAAGADRIGASAVIKALLDGKEV